MIYSANCFSSDSTSTTKSDVRTVLVFNSAERDFVLAEMRQFLTSIQKIVDALSKEKMSLVAEAAREGGAKAIQAAPKTLASKLPKSFKQLGSSTHKKFDMLALDANELGDPQYSMQQLSSLLKNCVACHSAYKINMN
jgi:cytochrome c556